MRRAQYQRAQQSTLSSSTVHFAMLPRILAQVLFSKCRRHSRALACAFYMSMPATRFVTVASSTISAGMCETGHRLCDTDPLNLRDSVTGDHMFGNQNNLEPTESEDTSFEELHDDIVDTA